KRQANWLMTSPMTETILHLMELKLWRRSEGFNASFATRDTHPSGGGRPACNPGRLLLQSRKAKRAAMRRRIRRYCMLHFVTDVENYGASMLCRTRNQKSS